MVAAAVIMVEPAPPVALKTGIMVRRFGDLDAAPAAVPCSGWFATTQFVQAKPGSGATFATAIA